MDEQKAGVDQEACELRASLREVERARLEGRKDLHELRRQLKNVESERQKLGHEISELQTHVSRHEQRADVARRENYDLKQKVKIFFLNYLANNSAYKRIAKSNIR